MSSPFHFFGSLVGKPTSTYGYSEGTTVPANAVAGYAKGHMFRKTDGGEGTTWYINEGTVTSCEFNPVLTGGGQNILGTGGTLSMTDADSLSIAGVIAPNTLYFSVPVTPHASLTTRNLFTAPRALIVVYSDWTNSLVQGGALTATLVKATGTAAPAKATTPLHVADEIDLNGVAANTVQALTASAAANRTLAAGDRLGMDHGAMTVAAGVATFGVQYL